MSDEPGMQASDTLLAVTTYCFDIAGLELFLPLINGARCYICDARSTSDPELLKDVIKRVNPTIMQATPSTWIMLFHAGWNNEENIKILCGGEALTESLKQCFVKSGSDVWNLYGPTETTIWSTAAHLSTDTPISIGRPIANTEIHILDTHKSPTPIGIPGELCIAGDGLAVGYLNKPDLTAAKFTEHPRKSGRKLYFTGDRARWRPDGTIECLGRTDFQVKFHGFRVELGEIESQLNRHVGIRESAVVVKELEGSKQLIAYYIPNDSGGSIEENRSLELKTFLAERLPGYMIPAFYIAIDEMPLTPNGKWDRKDLMNRKVKLGQDDQRLTPQTEIEKDVLAIWKDLLQLDEISITDGFFEVGGNSLSAVMLSERIKKAFGVEFTAANLFKYSNVQQISQFLHKVNQHGALDQTKNPRRKPLGIPATTKIDINESETSYPDYYKESLAIIGISCHFPGARDHYEFWQNLKEGKESAQVFTEDDLRRAHISEALIRDPNYVPVQFAIEGKDLFDPTFFNLSPRNAAFMDPQFRQLLLHSWQALEDAGYVPETIPDTSVYMSASNGYYQTLLKNSNKIRQRDEYVSWILAQGGTIPTMISYELGLMGPSMFIHTNCSSSLASLASAFTTLQTNESTYALVGASSLFASSDIGYIHQSESNFSSDGHCKPFDKSADGMVGGEGVAVVVLKKALNAIEDGDHIYALLRGIGLNNDGRDKAGFYAPSANGQAAVIDKVLKMTGIEPETIGYVEAHGTGTRLGDPVEMMALTEVYQRYGEKAQFCGIGSVKSNIGHLDTAAGLAGCIKVALSLAYGEIPPSINYETPNPEIKFKQSPFYVVDRLKKWSKDSGPRRSALSSFGIGGTNAHAILEEYSAPRRAKPTSDRSVATQQSFLIPLSAKNSDRISAYVRKLLEFLEGCKNDFPNLSDIAYTLQVGRKSMQSRVIFVVANLEELVESLTQFINHKKNSRTCFLGNIEKESEKITFFEKDDDAQQLTRTWISKGKWNNLAELWAKGGDVDWTLLYHSRRPHRISLPTYPFALERYGIDEGLVAKEAPMPTVKEAIHPFVKTNTSTIFEQRYSSVFSGNEFFLQTHPLIGKNVIPYVAYLEMAHEAVKHATDGQFGGDQHIQLRNVVWGSPLQIDDQLSNVHITLLPEKAGEIAYEIYSDHSNKIDGDSNIWSQGVARFDRFERPPLLSLADLKDRVAHYHLGKQEFYKALRVVAHECKSSLMAVDHVSVGDKEVLTKLTLPPAISETGNSFTLHPSLLDSALQSVICLRLDLRKQTLNKQPPVPHFKFLSSFPTKLHEIDIFGLCPASLYAWARYSKMTSQPKSIEISSQLFPSETFVDLDLCDEDGNVLVAMRGFSYLSYDINQAENPQSDVDQRHEKTAKSPSWTIKLENSSAPKKPIMNKQISLSDPSSFSSSGVREDNERLESPLSSALKQDDVLEDLKASLNTTGVIPTLNRTGVMLEALNYYSRSFADYAGQCGGEVLDIGCAYGVATTAAIERGGCVLAVDMEQRHLDILWDRISDKVKCRIKTQQGILPDVNFDHGRFAAIHGGRVIHFLKPDDVKVTLQKMYRWLRPGGKLFLTADTPYVGYWASKAPDYEARKQAGELWPGYIPDVDKIFDQKDVEGSPSLINPLDPDILERECRAANFEVEKVGLMTALDAGVGGDNGHPVAVGIIAVKPVRKKTLLATELSRNRSNLAVASFDNVQICYDVARSNSPSLVFVHGLGCDRSYWSNQISHYEGRYTLVMMDLAGHGASGNGRKRFTIEAFAQDVVAVIKQLDLTQVILIGHSLGGPVIVEAASLIPEMTIGMVGVDTLHNLEPRKMTPKEIDAYTEAFHATRGMPKDFMDSFDPNLAAYIAERNPMNLTDVTTTAFKEMVCYLQTLVQKKRFHAPLVLINYSDWVPTNLDVAKRYGVEVKLMKGKGHFPMIEDSEAFNQLLDETIMQFLENHSPLAKRT